MLLNRMRSLQGLGSPQQARRVACMAIQTPCLKKRQGSLTHIILCVTMGSSGGIEYEELLFAGSDPGAQRRRLVSGAGHGQSLPVQAPHQEWAHHCQASGQRHPSRYAAKHRAAVRAEIPVICPFSFLQEKEVFQMKKVERYFFAFDKFRFLSKYLRIGQKFL